MMRQAEGERIRLDLPVVEVVAEICFQVAVSVGNPEPVEVATSPSVR